MRKLLTLFLISVLVIGTVSATPFFIKAKMESVQNNGGANYWSTPIEFSLNLTESKTLFGVTVNYYDIGNSNTVALLRVSGGTATDAPLAENQQVCVKGRCNLVNGTPETQNDVRLTLVDIVELTTSSSSSGTNNTDESPIDAYIDIDGTKTTLLTDKTRLFDFTKYATKEELDTDDLPDFNVYLRADIPFSESLSIETSNKNLDKPEARCTHIGSEYKCKYILEESAKYIFKTEYKFINWAGIETDKANTYTLDLSGITSLKSNPLTSTSPYIVTLPNTQTVQMSKPGTFTQIPNVVITNNGENKYTFKFDNTGSYTATYTSSGGETATVQFDVQPAQVQPQPTSTTATANQIQNTVSGDNTTYIIVVVILLALGGFLWMKKKKSGGSKYNLHGNREG